MQVTFYEKVEAIDGTIQKILIGETEVPKEDGYIKLPENIYNSDKLIEVDVDVVDANGNIIIHDEVDLDDVIDNVATGDTPNNVICTRLCNGRTYAFSLTISEKTRFWEPTGTSIISVNWGNYGSRINLFRFGYRWMDETEWLELIQGSAAACGQGMCSLQSYENPNTFAHYGIHNNTDHSSILDGVRGIELDISTAEDIGLRRADDSRIVATGTKVYGIRKMGGQFRHHIGSGFQSDTPAEHYCGQWIPSGTNPNHQIHPQTQTSWINNMIIQNTEIDEQRHLFTENPLFCNQIRAVGGWNPNSGANNDLPDKDNSIGWGLDKDEWDTWIEWNDWWWEEWEKEHLGDDNWWNDGGINPGTNNPSDNNGGRPIINDNATIFDQLAKFRRSLSNEVLNTTGVEWWPGDNVKAIQFYQVKRCATTGKIATHDWASPITFYRDSLKNDDGTLNDLYIDFEKGLYNMFFIGNEGQIKNVLFDVSKTEKQSYGQNNFLVQTIYPVPLKSPSFDIDMEAKARLHFDYIVQDISGAIYYQEKNINVNKGDVISRKINTDNIPSFSTVIHRFEFSDGSVKTVTTQKF